MKKILKRGISGLFAVLMAFTSLAGIGTTTAFAASETAKSYLVAFPQNGDAVQIYDQNTWGYSPKTYMNGWTTRGSNYTTLHSMDSFLAGDLDEMIDALARADTERRLAQSADE